MEPIYVIGLMSGTSCDGVDAAIIKTDGLGIVTRHGGILCPYPISFQKELRQILGQTVESPEILDIEKKLTKYHIQAVFQVLQKYSLRPDQISLIGFHGQTIAHQPLKKFTWQIGDADLLARETGIDVVYNFRQCDVTNGGQGAPLVPIYHAALSRTLQKPIAIVNIGGIANVTWIGTTEEELLAFDTGPGNGLLNDWCLRHVQQPIDRDGLLASYGSVSERHIDSFMENPFLSRLPPKSLDRLSFSLDDFDDLSVNDGAATLTALTAKTIALSQKFFPKPVARWLIAGGGRHNPYMMRCLTKYLGGVVQPVDQLGWSADFLEAEAFAYLACRSWRGLPISYPGTTGVVKPLSGGQYIKGNGMKGF